MSVTFQDIYAMIAARPALLPKKGTNTVNDLSIQLERAQECCHPEIKRPRAAYYASAYDTNGIASTQQTLKALSDGTHGIQKFCAKLNADLRVYELNMTDPLPTDGLKEAEAAHIIAYGLMAVEEHVDCLMIESLSIGFDAARDAFDKALTADKDADVFAVAARYGGQDMCALIGAMLSARMAKIPVVAGYRTGQVLKRVAERLYGADDSTLVVASASDAADPIRILHYVYQTIGDMTAFEAMPSVTAAARSCIGCAA